MKLTAKLLAVMVVTLALALAVTTWLNVRREAALFDRDLRSDSLIVGRLVAKEYDAALRASGPAAASQALAAANQIGLPLAVHEVEVARLPIEIQGALARGETRALRDERAGADGRLATYVPVGRGTGHRYALEVTGTLANERRYVAATERRALVASVAALALAALAVAVLGVILIARPTRALVAKTRRVAAGDFSDPLRLEHRDELGVLAAEINAMTEALATADSAVRRENDARLAAVEQLRHADRLMTVGRLSAGLAHELGTPLNVIEGRAKMIQQGEVEGAEVADSARIVVEQARRITAIVRQLLDFARRGQPATTDVDLAALGREAVGLLTATARKAGVELVGPDTAAVVARGDAGHLAQVITNLIVNAIHATPRGGRVTVTAQLATAARPGPDARPTRHAALAVADTGAGMDAATRERIFEPFFTTKEVGQGTGLGLSVVHGIVTDHGGWVEVDSAPGRGSRFTVYLPCP